VKYDERSIATILDLARLYQLSDLLSIALRGDKEFRCWFLNNIRNIISIVTVITDSSSPS